MLIIISFNSTAQVQEDTTQHKSQNAIEGLSAKVPRLLVSTSDSTILLNRIAHRSSNLCDNPHGVLVIDDKELPCDLYVSLIVSLKPEDIEDIQVLTLADTHRIYGSKGDPYGALVLTTKKYAALKKEKPNATKKP